MATSGIQLVAQNTAEINQGIKDVIASLKSLEQQIAKNSKQVSLMDQIFGSSRGMTKFINLIGSVKATQFRGFGAAIKELVSAAKHLQSTDLSQTSNQLHQFMMAVRDAGKTDVAAFNTMVNSLKVSFATLSNIGISKNTATALQSLKSFISQYTNLSAANVNFANINTILFGANGIIPTIKQFFSELSKIQIPSAAGQSNIAGSIASLKAIVSSLSSLTNLSNLSGAVSKLKSFKFNPSDFKPFFDFVSFVANSLGRVAVKIRPDVVKSISEIIGSLGRIVKVLPALLELPNKIPGTIFSVGQRFKRFLEFQKIFAIVGFVARNFASISGKFKKIEGAEKLGVLTESLGRIARSIPELLRISESLGGGILQIAPRIQRFFQLRKLFIAIQQITGPLAQIARKTSKQAGGTESISAMADLLRALIDIAKESNNLKFDTGNMDKFNSFISSLGKSIKTFLSFGIRRQDIQAFREGLGSIGGGRGLTAFDVAKGVLIAKVITSIASSVKNLLSSILNLRSGGFSFLNEFADRIRSFGRDITDFGKSLGQNFGIGALTKSAGFNLAVGFEDLVNQFGIFAKNIPIKEAEEFANIIGIKYPLSANDALKATLDLAKAGLDFAGIKGILPSAADLAALSESKDLDRATNFLIAAEGSFKQFAEGVESSFNPENIKVAADTVFAAANVSTASIDSMTDALSKVGPAAAKMNLDLETASAIIAQFEDANIRGTEAGTLLRTVLAGFQTEKAQDELNRLGVAFTNVDGTFRNVGTEVIPEIVARYRELGLTQVQVAESIREFGDVYAQQGLSILIAKNATNDILKSMKDVPPAAESAAQAFSSFNGLMMQIGGTVETILNSAFYPLINRVFKPMSKLVLDFVNAIASLPPEVIELVGTMVAFGAIAASIAASVFILIGGFLTLGGVILKFGASFALILVKLPLLQLGLIGLVSSIGAFITIATALGVAFAGISHVFNSFSRIVEQNIGGAGDAIGEFFKEIRGLIGDVVSVFGILFSTISDFFGRVSSGAAKAEGTLIAGFFRAMAKTISTTRKELQGLVSILNDMREIGISQILNPVGFIRFNIALEQLSRNRIFRFLFGELDTAAVRQKLTEVFSGFAKIGFGFSQIKGGFVGIFTGEPGSIKRLNDGVSAVLSGITSIVEQFSGLKLGKAILSFNKGDIRQGIIEFGNAIVQGIADFILKHRQVIIDAITSIFNPFRAPKFVADLLGFTEISKALGALSDTFTFFFKNTLKTLFETFSGEKTLDEAILGNFGSGAQPFIDLFRSIGFAVEQFIGIWVDLINLLAGSGARGAVSGDNALQKIYNIFAGIAKIIKPVFDLVGLLFRSIRTALPGIYNSFTSILIILNPLNTLINSIVKEVVRIITVIGSLGQTANLGDFIREILTSVVVVAERIPSIIADILRNVAAALGIGRYIAQDIESGVSSIDVFGIIKDLVTTIANAFTSLIQGAGNLFIGIGENVGSSFLIGIGQVLQNFNLDFIGKIIDSIRLGDWRYVGDLVGSLLAGAITAAFDFVRSVINTLFQTVIAEEVGKSAGNAVSSAISFFIYSFGNFINGFVINVINRVVVAIQEGLSGLLETLAQKIPVLSGVFRLLSLAVNAAGFAIRFFLNVAEAIVDLATGLFQALVSLPSVLEDIAGKMGAVVAVTATLVYYFAGPRLIAMVIAFASNITALLLPALANWAQLLQFVATKAIAVLKPILGIGAAILVVVSIIKNLGTLLKGDLLQALADIIFDIGSFVLKVFGVSDEQISQIRSTLDMIVYFVNLAIRQIVTRLGQAMQDLSNKISILLDPSGETGKAFERAQKTFDDAKGKSGAEFVNTVGDEVRTAKELSNEEKSQIAREYLRETGDLLGVQGAVQRAEGGNVRLKDIVKTRGDDIITAAQDIFGSGEVVDPKTIDNLTLLAEKAGVLNEVILASSKSAELLNGTFSSMVNSELPALNNGARESFSSFVEGLTRAVPQGAELQETMNILNTAVEKGIIDQNDFNFAIRRLGLTMTETGQIADNTGTTIAQAGNSAKETWEELDQTIKGVSDTLDTTVSKEATIIGSFADNEKKQVQKLEDLYNRLFDAVDFGKIGESDADEYFDAVLQQMGILRSSERDKLNPFRNMKARKSFDTRAGRSKADPETDVFGADYEEYIKSLGLNDQSVQQDIVINPVITPGSTGGVLDTIPDPNDVQQESQEILDLREEYAEKEEKLKEDFAEKEAKLNDDISKGVQEYLREKRESEAAFNLESIRRAEDHNLSLEKIDEDGSKSLLQAVANRDSAAAQQAVRNRNEQIKEEKDKFSLDEKRRKEDFDNDARIALERANLRRQEQLDELLALQQERELKLRELNDERNLEIKKNTDVVAMTQQATRTQLDILSSFWRNVIQGTQGFAAGLGNQVTSVFSNIANSINGGLGAASSGVSAFVNSVVSTLQNSGVGRFVGNVTSLFRNTALGGAVQAGDQALNNIVNGVTNALNTASSGQNLGNAAQGALGALGSGFLNSIFGGGRAEGGPTNPGMMHPVLEKGEPELAYSKGKYFLMTPDRGFVTPPRAAQNRSGGGRSLTFNMNGWQVTGNNASEIADEIEGRIMTNITREIQIITGDR